MSNMDKQFLGSKSQYSIDPVTENPSSSSYQCHLAIIREDDGTYSVLVLNLPGTGSCGDTEAEAMANVREAIRGVIETYAEDGEKVPWVADYDIPEGASQKLVLVDA